MKISELIALLEEYKDKHGDLPVYLTEEVYDDEYRDSHTLTSPLEPARIGVSEIKLKDVETPRLELHV